MLLGFMALLYLNYYFKYLISLKIKIHEAEMIKKSTGGNTPGSQGAITGAVFWKCFYKIFFAGYLRQGKKRRDLRCLSRHRIGHLTLFKCLHCLFPSPQIALFLKILCACCFLFKFTLNKLGDLMCRSL